MKVRMDFLYNEGKIHAQWDFSKDKKSTCNSVEDLMMALDNSNAEYKESDGKLQNKK